MPYQKKLIRNYNPANRLTPDKINLIVRLHTEGKSQREIEAITEICRNVIRKYTAGYKRNPAHYQHQRKEIYRDPTLEEIAERAAKLRLTWGLWDDDDRDSA